MKLVLQRVERACVRVGGETVGEIGGGLLVLVGIGAEDGEAECERLAAKLVNLRIFSDGDGKTNLPIKDVGGELLVISQFTLYADCRKGNRPNFLLAKEPKEAERLYEYFTELCRRDIPVVRTGVFGAEMKVELLNDGPFTIILE